MVVGAPSIAAAAARWPRKKLLLWLLAAFTLGTLASALLPTFGLVMVARFISALPHGAYFGIASLVAASLMGDGRRGQGVAFVLSGLTIAKTFKKEHLLYSFLRVRGTLPLRESHSKSCRAKNWCMPKDSRISAARNLESTFLLSKGRT